MYRLGVNRCPFARGRSRKGGQSKTGGDEAQASTAEPSGSTLN